MRKITTNFGIKSLFLLLVASITLSCNQPKERNTVTPEQAMEVATSTDEHQETSLSQWQKDIQLDQGQPWKANKATTDGIKNMSKLIHNEQRSSATAYRELAASLNEEMNTLIQKCTMTGPSHDNLHVYLQPLLLKLSELTKVESSKEGAQTTLEIMHHLEQYDTYFF